MIKTLVLPVFLVLFITSVLGGAIGGVLPIGGFFQSPTAHIQLPAEAIPDLDNGNSICQKACNFVHPSVIATSDIALGICLKNNGA